MSDVIVLNEMGGGNRQEDQESVPDTGVVAREMQTSMLKMTGKFLDEKKGTVDYKALGQSDEFREYCVVASQLVTLDVDQLNEEKMPFFINIYNALTVHAIVQIHEEKDISSALDVPNFWSSFAYKIGGRVFTLDDIEHGILRGNKAHPSTGQCLLGEGDERLKLRMESVDPRIHFALNCGAKSCPMVRVYSSRNLEHALEGATRSYLNQEVELKGDLVRLPEILSWYLSDFAPSQLGMLRWIQPYLEAPQREALDALIAAGGSAGPRVEFFYNWSLNKA